MNKIEVCLDADNLTLLADNAYLCDKTSVDRIELCSTMSQDGLTPTCEAIKTARRFFQHGELMVMIRPRAGGFNYSDDELLLMKKQIHLSSKYGADGVVFGVINAKGKLDIDSCDALCTLAESLTLKTTFHRAFDALTEPELTLTQLKTFSINHVLTCGIPWSSRGSAMDGIDNLNRYISAAKDSIEVVIGGGITPQNIVQLNEAISPTTSSISFHSFSGILDKQRVNRDKVLALKQNAPYL
ncbi:copper homeostasis protein CutC [Thalassotalea sediminis]|uniref:copper homeostasis protein CutC n=1 Tax=Thalassotalea sediminis TaxID=1759089 RepID=UPI002572CC96|nr:copper homeostasis protein CutC [Thalassotalea sediminis]